MLTYIRKFPALALSLASAVVTLALHFVPGLPSEPIMGVISAAVALLVGAEVHRRVTAVPTDQRGFRPVQYEFESTDATTDDTQAA